MKTASVTIGLVVAIASLGCVPSPKSGKGFRLPDGNVEKGKEAFIALKCNACHTIEGVEQFVTGTEKPEPPITLGGEVVRMKTYGELVTSIINPSHQLAKGYPAEQVSIEGKSKMEDFNDVMTITQLTDLVAFLQSKYKLPEYETMDYPLYY